MNPTMRGLHMGNTELEAALFDFQHGMICYMEAFHRHIESQLIRVTGDPNMSAQDCIILHAVRLGDRPKSMPDIQHFTNRTDLANIQYSVRKLLKAGLIQKAKKDAGGRGVSYELTRKGREVTNDYVRARQEVTEMIPLDAQQMIAELRTSTRLALLLTGVYDHVSRTEAAR